MTDRQTDRLTGKNNMSPDPVGGRHKNVYRMYLHGTQKAPSAVHFDHLQVACAAKCLANIFDYCRHVAL